MNPWIANLLILMISRHVKSWCSQSITGGLLIHISSLWGIFPNFLNQMLSGACRRSCKHKWISKKYTSNLTNTNASELKSRWTQSKKYFVSSLFIIEPIDSASTERITFISCYWRGRYFLWISRVGGKRQSYMCLTCRTMSRTRC